MATRLAEILRTIRTPELRNLAECFLMDSEFMGKFTACPAGMKNHHAYKGGLLEHVVSLMELVLAVARAHAAAGGAVVVVLHDLNLAGAYADRVVVLSRGRTAAQGPPETVFTPQLLSDVYSHQVEVLDHPRSPAPIIVPLR
jgi:hypothetical protein